MSDALHRIEAWFASRGWTCFDFQRSAWQADRDGQEGLIHASTGTGKTYAALFGPISEALDESSPAGRQPAKLQLLWITPLRALANDITLSLTAPLAELGLNWDVGARTSDTSTRQRAKQKTRLPSILVTTPESLALLQTQPEAREAFAELRAIVVDEWHELLSSKRGVMVELALARLRKWCPKLRVWGLSATLGNLEEAASTLVGPRSAPCIIHGEVPKQITIDSIIPATTTRFPWAGHLGTSLVEQVVAAIEESATSLVFTNTRAQTELWYQAILAARPNWAGLIALHHGSLDRGVRDWVEEQLRNGSLRCVVCTSTLDLGVDYSPVDRVLQIGSPKGVARLLQRAGRSGHRPGSVSRVTCVPTNTLELLEIAAAREAVTRRQIEARIPCRKPLDLLAQHLISCGLFHGFLPDELYQEITSTAAYEDLTIEEWNWTLNFAARGGDSLRAYPDYHRLQIDSDGRYSVVNNLIAKRHRLAMGTILGDTAILVRFLRGGKLGTVEESFAARLKPGDRFAFAGRLLQVVRMEQQTLLVRKTTAKPTTVPRWMGGRMPFSTELSEALRELLCQIRDRKNDAPEVQAADKILETQRHRSHIPGPNELLVEQLESREGFHLYLYPFEGWLVHEGLAALLAYRVAQWKPITLTMAVNDYGLELVSAERLDFTVDNLRQLLSPVHLAEDIAQSLNMSELIKRQFREVARVAGLIFPGMPHAGKTMKQLQASTNLFYNVFLEYEPNNLLLWQAQREVLERQMEEARMRAALRRITESEIIIKQLDRPSPLGFPLLVERLRGTLSSEKVADRFRRLAEELEARETA